MKFSSIAQAKKETGLSYLGGVNLSAKMIKNQKVSQQLTYGLYLSPANTSGYEVCSHATKECRLGCLATSGRTAMEIFSGKDRIQKARIAKTKLFFEHREFFMNWLIAEIKQYQKQAITKGYGFSVRLNCTSDIDWANVIHNDQSVFDMFPNVSFYDYTKNPRKFLNKPSNYHLTFSYTGYNWQSCESLLKDGVNIAMIFNAKNESELPETYKGFKVMNGDLTDFRPNDGFGVIVGLKWKRIANRTNEKIVLNSPFVVNTFKNINEKIVLNTFKFAEVV